MAHYHGVYHELVLIDQSQLRERQRELHLNERRHALGNHRRQLWPERADFHAAHITLRRLNRIDAPPRPIKTIELGSGTPRKARPTVLMEPPKGPTSESAPVVVLSV